MFSSYCQIPFITVVLVVCCLFDSCLTSVTAVGVDASVGANFDYIFCKKLCQSVICFLDCLKHVEKEIPFIFCF